MASTQVRACSIASALDVVGDRWSLLVVRELSLGVSRFNDLVAHTGAPRDVLTARLRKLEAVGVLARQEYSARPPRHEYLLTDAGRDLAPVLQSLLEWGSRHAPAPAEEALHFDHDCGALFVPVLSCAACGRAVEPGSLSVAAGADGLPQD